MGKWLLSKKAYKCCLDEKSMEEKTLKEENHPKVLSIDDYLMKIGELGRFQIISLIIFAFIYMIPGYQALILVFIAQSPSWRCSGHNLLECNTTDIYDDDSIKNRCNMSDASWEYVSPVSYSIVSQVKY